MIAELTGGVDSQRKEDEEPMKVWGMQRQAPKSGSKSAEVACMALAAPTDKFRDGQRRSREFSCQPTIHPRAKLLLALSKYVSYRDVA